MATEAIRVQVAYVDPAGPFLADLELPAGSTVADAVCRCRVMHRVPQALVDEVGLE